MIGLYTKENIIMENRVGENKESALSYMPVDELDLNNESRCILVRLLRTWEARNFKRNKELMSFDFLLLDEKDCLIQGSIHHLLLYRFRDKLKDGRIFLIRDFDVVRSGDRYRLTNHQYMIRFTDATNLEEVDEEKYVIRPEKFRLHSHDELVHLVGKNVDLPDVVGFLCKFEKTEPYGETKPKRAVLHICLEEDIETRLTIWDDLADSVGEKLREINERTIVIVATSLIPKTFGGKLCLNQSSATKVYLNADFEAVTDFRGRMKIQPQIDDSFKNVERTNSGTRLHTITEILHFISNEKEQAKEFTCKAKIREVILRNGWNYISCSNCARKMEKTETALTCKNCSDSQTVGVLRFRIEVVVDDGSDTTTFVIFDKEAKKITNTTAPALMTDIEVDADKDGRDQAPAAILNIVGKTHKFQVKVTQYNFRTKYQSFSVSRILDDISKIEKDEPRKKEILVTEEAKGSSSTATTNIKIEETKAKKESGKLEKGTVKRRKLQKNGKKTSQQELEDRSRGVVVVSLPL